MSDRTRHVIDAIDMREQELQQAMRQAARGVWLMGEALRLRLLSDPAERHRVRVTYRRRALARRRRR